jgi:hypothetical protein
MSTPPPSAHYFDGWYADMVGSPVKDDIQRRHLGLPSRLQSTSTLPWDGIAGRNVVGAGRRRLLGSGGPAGHLDRGARPG